MLLEHGKNNQEDAARGQVGLFGAPGAAPSPSLPDIEECEMTERLRMEKESLGFYLSHHPLEDVWPEIKKYTYQQIAELADRKDGRTVRIGGMFTNIQKRISKKGNNFATFNLEDLTDKVNGIIFSQAYDNFGHMLVDDAFVVVKARIDVDEMDSRDDSDEGPKKTD